MHSWFKRAFCAFALVVGLLNPGVGHAQAGATPQVTVSVQLPDGAPAPHATIFLNDMQVEADAAGTWQGAVSGTGRIYESAGLPGYASRGIQWVEPIPPPIAGPPGVRFVIPAIAIVDHLQSVFNQPKGYRPGEVAPTITQFVTDTGIERQQVVPAETSAVTVSGTVGSARGLPIVRSDGWLALPDDSVHGVPVAVGPETFSVTFPIVNGPGRYQLEVNDISGGAIINVPVFVGVPYAADAQPIPTGDLSPEISAQQALDALNQLRQQHTLPAVAVDPRLEAIAQDHVADLQANHWYCHCWGDGTTIFDHVRATDINVRNRPLDARGRYVVGVGEGFTTEQGAAAIAALFTSPGHRGDLLGVWSHVGIASAGGDLPVLVIEYADEINGP